MISLIKLLLKMMMKKMKEDSTLKHSPKKPKKKVP
jgi:hypothetical protein